jgi:cholest-4-en-3-one 26-monooxygenase
VSRSHGVPDPATFAHGFPHETFRALRRDDPVSHHDHPVWKRGYWVIARHADVQRVSRDSDTFSNAPNPFIDSEMAEDDASMSELLISQDPPLHTKLRKLINKGFTPRRVAQLEDRVRDRVDRIVGSIADRRECDLVTDIALWLPLHVIADLVGVPRKTASRCSAGRSSRSASTRPSRPTSGPTPRPRCTCTPTALCEQRRAEPRDDLMSVLITAEVNGETLTQMQIDLFFLLLQNAGSETTRNLITTGMIVLLQHPDQLERLRADTSMLPAAIEELLRWVSPVMQFTRRATKDTEIAGHSIAPANGSCSCTRRPTATSSRSTIPTARRHPFAQRSRRVRRRWSSLLPGRESRPLRGAGHVRGVAHALRRARGDRRRSIRWRASTPNLIDGYANVPIRWDSLQPAGSRR